MWQSETIIELAKALSQLQSDLKPLKKNKENPFFKSKYADFEAVSQHIKPLLKPNGLSYTQFPSSKNGEPTLVTQVMHTSGEWIRAESSLYLTKQDQQSVGSAITYAKRQALAGAFGVSVTDEDDDGESNAVLELNAVRKLYDHARTHQGIEDEMAFLEIVRKFYGKPISRDTIPKDDYSKLMEYIENPEKEAK